jgi:cell division protein DivIC
MKLIRRIPPILRNKFVLASAFFIVWMLFFDKNDVFSMIEKRKELSEIQKSKHYFEGEIEANRKFANDLKTNPAAIEKFAREKYLMKKANEDLFLVQKVAAQ